MPNIAHSWVKEFILFIQILKDYFYSVLNEKIFLRCSIIPEAKSFKLKTLNDTVTNEYRY